MIKVVKIFKRHFTRRFKTVISQQKQFTATFLQSAQIDQKFEVKHEIRN